MDELQMNEQCQQRKSSKSYMRRGKPKDSVPKIHLISNRGSRIKNKSHNSNILMRINLNKNEKNNNFFE